MTEAEFWRSTPFLTGRTVKAYHRRAMLAFQCAMFGAWHAAGFARVQRMPPLAQVMRPFEAGARPARQQTPDEMLAIAESMVLAMGGQDLRKPAEQDPEQPQPDLSEHHG